MQLCNNATQEFPVLPEFQIIYSFIIYLKKGEKKEERRKTKWVVVYLPAASSFSGVNVYRWLLKFGDSGDAVKPATATAAAAFWYGRKNVGGQNNEFG